MLRPLFIDVTAAGARYLSFAKNKLQQLRELHSLIGVDTGRKTYVIDGATITLGAFPDFDRIRITDPGAPWYFLCSENGPLSGGVRTVWSNQANIEDEGLVRRVVYASTSSTGFSFAAVRARGKSYGFFHKIGETKLLNEMGTASSLADPLSLLSAESFITGSIAVDYGSARPAFVYVSNFSSGVAKRVVYTDGRVVETVDVVDVVAKGVCAAPEDTYYWAVTGASPYTFRLYRAPTEYPVNDGGDQIASTPEVAEEVALESLVEVLSVASGNVRVVSNDYDIMSVLVTKDYTLYGTGADTSGMAQIRIGHSVVWSSTGSSDYAAGGLSIPNWDDANIVFAAGFEDEFLVVLSNAGGYYQFNQPDLISGMGTHPALGLRFLRFTRTAEPGIYQQTEFSVSVANVSLARIETVFSVAGTRSFLSYASSGEHAGWIDDTGVFTEVVAFSPSFAVLPTFTGAKAALFNYALGVIAFSDSETLTNDTYSVPGPVGAVPSVHAVATDGEKMFALAGEILSISDNLSFVDSDGTQYVVPRTDGAIPLNLVVDEVSRVPYTLMPHNDTGAATPDYRVVRYNHVTQTSDAFTDENQNALSPVRIPTFSQHYQNRLLRHWLTEDSE